LFVLLRYSYELIYKIAFNLSINEMGIFV